MFVQGILQPQAHFCTCTYILYTQASNMPGQPTRDRVEEDVAIVYSDHEEDERQRTLESPRGSLDSILSEICDDPASTLFIPDATIASPTISPSPSPPPTNTDGVYETDSGILQDQGLQLISQ